MTLNHLVPSATLGRPTIYEALFLTEQGFFALRCFRVEGAPLDAKHPKGGADGRPEAAKLRRAPTLGRPTIYEALFLMEQGFSIYRCRVEDGGSFSSDWLSRRPATAHASKLTSGRKSVKSTMLWIRKAIVAQSKPSVSARWLFF